MSEGSGFEEKNVNSKNNIHWGNAVVATIVAGAAMQAVMALIWMNPLTMRLILSPEFGQSEKLINVWTVWKPLPLILEHPSYPIIAGFFFFTFLHVLVYQQFCSAFPGKTWIGKGLSLALGIWIFQYGYFEFFTPFNLFHEPLPLIGVELLLHGITALVEAMIIARLSATRGL